MIIAFGFLAGDVGNIVRKGLEQEGLPAHFVPVPGQTRINVTVVEDSGRASSFHGPGPAASPEGLASLEGLVRFWLQAGASWYWPGAFRPECLPLRRREKGAMDLQATLATQEPSRVKAAMPSLEQTRSDERGERDHSVATTGGGGRP